MFNSPSNLYADALMRNVYDRSMPQIEREGGVNDLEQQLFQTLEQIVTPDPYVPVNNTNKQLPSDNKFVTPEDAIKELQELQKQGLL